MEYMQLYAFYLLGKFAKKRKKNNPTQTHFHIYTDMQLCPYEQKDTNIYKNFLQFFFLFLTLIEIVNIPLRSN